MSLYELNVVFGVKVDQVNISSSQSWKIQLKYQMGSLKHLKLSGSIVGAKSKWQVPQQEKAKEEKLDLKVCGLKIVKSENSSD